MKILRTLFLLLLLVNIVLFAWWQGYLAPWGPSTTREPQRLAAQVAPEKLRLVPHGETTEANTAAAEKSACRWIDGIKEVELKALLAAPQPLASLELKVVETEVASGYEIAIPALANQAAAQAKQAEVKALGIDAPSAIAAETGGTYRLVLGRAPDQPAAEAQLLKLKEKGVKSARVQPLPLVKASRLQATGLESAFAALDARLAGTAGVHTQPCTEP